jgi:hypothetical protein
MKMKWRLVSLGFCNLGASFLNLFSGNILATNIVQLIEAKERLDAAVLRECIRGYLLKSEAVTEDLVSKNGEFLACIHLKHAEGFKELRDPSHLISDSNCF